MSRKMTNSEAISNLNHIYGMVSPDIQRSLDLAIKALEEVEKVCPYLSDNEVKQPCLQAPCERPQGKWIPVSERLPIRNGVYIVTRIIEGTRITDASYFDGQNTWHRDVGVNHGRPYLNDVIAWQPRPEPYKKGGAE